MDLLSRFVQGEITDGDTLRLLGMAAHAIGDTVRSVDFLTRSEVLLREQGRLGLLSHVLSMQVIDRLELGDWDRASAAAAEGERLARETGQPIWRTGTLVCDAMDNALRGQTELAFAYAAEVEMVASRQRLNDLLSCVQLVRGAALSNAGRYHDAYPQLRGGLDEAFARDVLARQAAGLSYADSERILREAAGNPLALVELPLAVRAAADAGMETLPQALPLTARLERAFAARIVGLPPLTRDTVLIAAVDNADDLPEILAGASALAGQPVTVAAVEAAMAAGLLRFDDLHVHFRHPLVRSGVLQLETAARRYAANAALAEVLVHEPYRRTWHRAQSVSGQDDQVADELEAAHVVSLRRGSATEAIWVLERSAQLTTDPAKRGRRQLLAAEHASGLGRADLVDRLLTRVAGTSLSRLDQARMAWLREIFNDGVHAIGDLVRAADFLSRAETKLRQHGRLGLLSQVLNMQVLDNLELGDWDRAVSCAEEAKRLAHETGQPLFDTGSLSLHAMIVALRGDNEQAQSMASEVERAAGSRRLNSLLCCVQLIRGFGLISAGQHTEAYEALCRVFDPADPSFHLADRYHGVMFLAEAAVHAGRVREAREVIAGLEAEAATTPAPTLHRQLSYARPVLADDGEAEDLFTEALRADLIRWPWLRARLELAYGRWLRRQRRVTQARLPLRSAQITFDLIGARSWAEQARSELRAAGERIQAQEPNAQDVLSAQELQIARLAAEGLSNRAIGERLYLSHRTVGTHLYRIFPKLEITSRAQLAGRLRQA